MFRRGKLSFLSTKDDRIKIVNERINLTEKHLNEMRSNFGICARKMAKQRDAYDELAKGFKTYAEEEEINESLSEGMKSFTNAVTILGDYMDLNVHRMEVKIVTELAQFEGLCKATRDNLRTAVIARDKEVLKQRQMLELKSKFAANNSAADSELLKAKLEVNRTNKEIDEIINNFEKRKLCDIKTMLTDFILVSMKYHTKALEALSASYYDVSNIDERHDFVEFQKLMKTKEEPKTQKLTLKKGLRSQSMDNLEHSELLSPLKRRGRITRSSKNLTDKKTDDDEEQEDDEEEDEDDEEEEEESGDNTNPEDEDSGTVSEEESAPEVQAGKIDKKGKSRDPFKTVVATHVREQRRRPK